MDRLLQRPPLLLSRGDRRRIQGFALNALLGEPRLAGPLLREADRASVVADALMPATVAGVGSWVRYRDVGPGVTRRAQLVAKPPTETRPDELSLLDPVGAALVGLGVGQSILWQDDLAGPRLIEVLSVTRDDQPA